MTQNSNHMLVDKTTRAEINSGDTVTTFRGEKGVLKSFRPPHKPSSSGHVYVDLGTGHTNEWYPSVIGAEIVERR